MVFALALAGCASTINHRSTMPLSAREWLATLSTAKSEAQTGHYDSADRTLTDYAQRYAGSAEAREATYWRAVFTLDPANTAGSPRAAEEQLDVYLADTATTLHRSEALTLRRLAAALDSLDRRGQAAATTSDSARADDAQKAQQRQEDMQKEIQRLKDQLDKTTAELDRIKKRLADHTP